MQLNLDTNIENYGLCDILNLFQIPAAFNEEHLKHAKRIVLKTHPDKSPLPKEYFLFFTKAYRILHRIYSMRHEQAQGYAHADKYNDLISGDQDYGCNASTSVATMNKLSTMDPSEFNKWFNDAFERYRVPDDDRDNGYEEWFRNGDLDKGETEYGNRMSKTQWASSIESARSRMMALVPGSASEPVSYYSGGDGSKNLHYEDLKQAHTETMIPITEHDIQTHTSSRSRNVEDLRLQRSSWSSSFVPASKTEAMRRLDLEKEHDVEQSTHRAYAMAKQDEIAREMNKKFMRELRTICNS